MSTFVRRTTRPEKPIGSLLGRLDIELTERCDNDCIHCCINLPAYEMRFDRSAVVSHVEALVLDGSKMSPAREEER